MDKRRKRKSTNPFDDSSDEEAFVDDVFHDCKDVPVGKKRHAQLDFDFVTSQDAEAPALRFDDHSNNEQATDFFSPLESAFLNLSAEAEGGSDVGASDEPDEDDEDDSPTNEESRWLSLIKKASGTLVGSSPFRRTEDDVSPPQERGEGRMSRRNSHGSFKSARSKDSDADSISREEGRLGTPVQSRRGSRWDDLSTSSHSDRRETLKRRSSSRKQLHTLAKAVRSSPVLEKLEAYDKDFDFESTAAPWTKMILLEELGTASSWTILLLPYVAFLISVLLDTRSSFLVTSVGPLSASPSCVNNATGPHDVPVLPTPSESCFYPFALRTGQGILASGKNSYLLRTLHYKELMRNGTAFESGPIDRVSPLSTFLYGDVYFTNLSTDAVALVANGGITVSTVVIQRTPGPADEWVPVSVAKPEPLSMVCTPDTIQDELPSSSSLWNCSSPRIVNVLFPLPGTGILSGSELRVNVLYSPYFPAYSFINTLDDDDATPSPLPNIDKKGAAPYVFSETAGVETMLSKLNVLHPDELIAEIVTSSSYVMEHESRSYAKVKIIVRLSTLLVSVTFTIFWCWSLGGKGFFAGGNCCCCSGILCCLRHGSTEDALPLTGVRQESSMWWESPWIVFPERRYLLVLLFCLMMIQNPLLAYAHFHYELYALPEVHTIADIMIGIGVHGFLMMWLCLVQGVRYHTAAFARRRAKHQRQLLELRRTAKYMTKTESGDYGTDEYVSRYMSDYYDQFGDVDGIRSAESLAIRLKSDPCGDSWADFLIPKLVLFVMGSTAVILTAVCRFPTSAENAATLTPRRLHRLNALYVTGSVIQLFVLLFWGFLILRNSYLTGAKLRKEPFLSTRPAQLAYRVLLGMLFLGVGALIVPLLIDLFKLIEKWTFGQKAHAPHDPQVMDRSPIVDIFLKILSDASERVPYSGTAASIGPGKILFATTIALVSAFIFLPSRPYYDTEKDAIKTEGSRNIVGDEGDFSSAILERIRSRRDKRLVVSLARHAHTWRAFPLPIEKGTVGSKMLAESSFQLNKSERSVVYFGRYTPVFCLEIACWLMEASWQAYYSPKEFSLDDWAPGRMALESIGLTLEHSIIDETMHTQAYVASNIASQVDGEEDSIIVVAFRGTANSTNMKTDLNFRQVPLFEQIMGTDEHATFEVRSDRIDAYDHDDKFWDTPMARKTKNLVVSPSKSRKHPDPASFHWHDDQQSALAAVSSGAKAVIKATPMARQALPCVHEGFLEAYSHVRQQVLEGVLEVLQRQFSKAVTRSQLNAGLDADVPLVLPKIYITGHSLGGSLAQLLALDIASNCELVVDVPPPNQSDSGGAEDFFLLPPPTDSSRETRARSRLRLFSFDGSSEDISTPKPRTMRLQPPIAVYTYGQPRVGNIPFAKIYKKRVPHTFRVACEGDAFTTMPPTFLCGWSGIYKHAGLEVMLDEGCTGNTLVGPTVVETLLRFTKLRASIAAHSMERYRDSLESGLGQDELEEYYRGHGTLKEARGSSEAYAGMPEWLTRMRRSVSDE